MPLPKIDRLSAKLGASIALLVLGAMAAALVLVYHHLHDHLLHVFRENASMETMLIRQALEHQMQEKNRGLIRKMIYSFAKQRSVHRVMVLDRTGNVRHTSDPSIRSSHFDASSPTCSGCHSSPVATRQRSTTLEINGGKVLRCVQPIPNRKACHGCHDPRHRTNGLIIVDVPLERPLALLERSVVSLGVGAGVIGLVLLGGIGVVFRRLLMRRLLRFAATARAIAKGNLEQRVPIDGQDALTNVELQFNTMADSVTGLLARLQEQQASLEKVINSVDDGVVVLDRALGIVAVNEALVRRFPSVEGGLIGRRCGCSPSQHHSCALLAEPQGDCPTARCFATGDVQTAIITRHAADGGVRQEEVRASPVHAADGQISQVVEVWRDITDRRSAEARLAEYQRLVSLGMLASGFSHEVNTPLASIGTCLEGIRRSCGGAGARPDGDEAQVARFLEIASTQVARCGEITQQFLKLAKGQTLAQEIVDLPACARTIAGLAAHTAAKEGLGVEVEAGAEIPKVLANESAVQQVLLNLTLNAIEASARGQVVHVGFVTSEVEVRVLVRDEGRGIAPEDLASIFEPFFTRREQGTGLGLFVSLNLTRSWGGDILVESTPRVGTTFSVLFPRPGVDR